MVDHHIAKTSRQQITAMARMALLVAPLMAWAIALAAARTAEAKFNLARSVTVELLVGIPGSAAPLLLNLVDTDH